jgi:uncharacterized membrane protein
VLVVVFYLSRLGTPDSDGYVNAGDQVQFVLQNPLSFLGAMYETLSEQGDWILREAIGVFGWDDTTLPLLVYFAFIAIAAAVLYHAIVRAVLILTPLQIAVVLGVVVLTVLSLVASLYVVWTPVGADRIEGVQGRYLIGLMPLAVFGIGQLSALVGRQRLLNAVIVLFLPVVLYNLYRAIDLRYYG